MPRNTVPTGKGQSCVFVIGALLAASDPIDRLACARVITPRANVRIANRAPAIGRTAFVAESDWLRGGTAAPGHGFCKIWPSRNAEAVLLELDLTPIAKGPSLPIALIMRGFGAEGTVSDLRFYFDPSPVAGYPRVRCWSKT